MQTTPNLGLLLPEATDFVNVQDLSDNFSKIDTALNDTGWVTPPMPSSVSNDFEPLLWSRPWLALRRVGKSVEIYISVIPVRPILPNFAFPSAMISFYD